MTGPGMTEAEWEACVEPARMLDFLRRGTSDRKFRLFTVACCRRAWNLLPQPACRRAVEIAELFADGDASEAELNEACDRAGPVQNLVSGR